MVNQSSVRPDDPGQLPITYLHEGNGTTDLHRKELKIWEAQNLRSSKSGKIKIMETQYKGI